MNCLNIEAYLCLKKTFRNANVLIFNHLGDVTLETLLSENAQYVLKLSQLVLQESDREKTRLYANLILSQGYIRVVIEEMVEEGE